MQQIELMYDASVGSVQYEQHFTFVNNFVIMTSHLKENQFLWEKVTCKWIMVYAGAIWEI